MGKLLFNDINHIILIFFKYLWVLGALDDHALENQLNRIENDQVLMYEILNSCFLMRLLSFAVHASVTNQIFARPNSASQ